MYDSVKQDAIQGLTPTERRELCICWIMLDKLMEPTIVMRMLEHLPVLYWWHDDTHGSHIRVYKYMAAGKHPTAEHISAYLSMKGVEHELNTTPTVRI